MAQETAANIINDAANRAGLASVTDPFGSTDPNFIQLCSFLKSGGRDLLNRRNWTRFQCIWAFLTTEGVSQYAFPDDYRRQIDQTGWNRSNRLPMGGALSPQEYEYLQARLVGVTFNVLQRQFQGTFVEYPSGTQAPSYLLAYEYLSKYWTVPAATLTAILATDLPAAWFPSTTYAALAYVTSGGNIYQTTSGGTSGTYNPQGTTGAITDGSIADWTYISAAGAEAPTAAGDYVLLDREMVTAKLRLDFLLAKGLPSQAAQDDFVRAFDQAANADGPQPALNFTKRSWSEPLISDLNLPVTGYGV